MREKRKAERQTEPQREARGERVKWIRSQMRTEPQRGRSLAETERQRDKRGTGLQAEEDKIQRRGEGGNDG